MEEVTLVDLKGDFLPDQQALHLADKRITLQMRPMQIVTIALAFK